MNGAPLFGLGVSDSRVVSRASEDPPTERLDTERVPVPLGTAVSAPSRRPSLRSLLPAGVGVTAGAAFGILLVLVIVPPAPPPPCTALECGPLLTLGNPVGPTLCSPPGEWSSGCLAPDDYVYRITIETSQGLSIGEIRFAVLSSSGSTFIPPGPSGFSVLSSTGLIVASYDLPDGGPLEMTGGAGWTYYTTATGISAGSPLTSVYTIAVDVGSTETGGIGLELVALSSEGTTAPISLP